MTVKKNNQLVSVVVGLQFGDEGKGKVTDYLSAKHDVVIRYNGGGNAGHTVVTQTGTFKFHLIPSGALQAEVVILTNGMVIDPIALNDEIKRLKELNPKIKIEVSEHASVVTDLHKFLDLAEEDARKALRIGTTAQGIGPTYEDKYGRTGLRMADLLDPVILKEKMLLVTRMKQSLIEGSEFIYESRLDDMVLKLHESGKILKPYLKDTCNSIQKYYSEGKNIMFEGAHGALLDIDFGIYPYVTSSNTVAGAITNDSGFSFRKVREVIGVAKAYVSKVGNGPFPTEIKGKNAEFLRQLGSEYDVIATTNLNGDYLSDAIAAQVGGIGLAPGGNVGDIHAIFEAVHGTAPKYAGMDVANPTSLLLSGSMMLTYIGWKEASDILERAIMESYKDRKVTQDVARLMNIKPLKCSEFGLEVMKRMTRPQE